MGSITEFRGAKGGSEAHTPVEAPNSLRSISYFRILDLLSEGEIGGLVNGLQSVYLDDTPVANADGSLNFTGVAVQQRTGTQTQDVIAGWSATENEISVSTELKAESPWVRSLSNTSLSAVRLTLQVDALQQQDAKTGDVNGYTVQFAIDVQTDGGQYQTVLTSAFTGKTTTAYQRSIRIDLPKATSGWNLRVRRLTTNANSNTIADTTRIVSYTEIVDAKLRYPNSALIAISGDASAFSNIPSRAYDVWGRLIRVPSNYDPHTRVYTGVWDGTFQTVWTDNPAWVWYDIVTQDRFGLGALIDASLVDKWSLYRIAQYCDQLVDDGKGGQEPRFTCNCYLQQQADAYRVLSDIASIWNGQSYWAGGTVTASADMPDDPVYTYTAANVVGGKFTYQGSARKTRYTAAQVTWNDPSNGYAQVVEYVEDPEGLARYGLQENAFAAFGCTSQGQARRAGKWNNLTSRLETDSVTFQVALDGLMSVPGQYIRVQDPKRAGARQGGRLRVATTTQVTVDRAADLVAVGDSLTVNMPTGISETRTISAIAGNVLTVGQGFSQAPATQAVWAVESATLATQLFKVLTVTEDQQGGADDGSRAITFTLSCIQHVPGKFAQIDNGTIIQVPPISRLPTGAQAPATNVRITSHQVLSQGTSNSVMTIEWDAPTGAARYMVEWQKDGGTWIQAGTISTTSVDITGIYTGTYTARVTAYSNGNTASLAALSSPTALVGKTGSPPSLTALSTKSILFGIEIDWGLPARGAEDASYTEIYYSTTNAFDTAVQLGTFAYPQYSHVMQGLSAGATMYFWGRLVDKTGNLGPWYPTTQTGVIGAASSDATAILVQLNGQLTTGQLGAGLLSSIGDIDLNAEGIIVQSLAQANTDDASRAARAYIVRLDKTKVDDTQAQAIAQETVEAAIGDTVAQVQETKEALATLDGNLKATYTVKTNLTVDGKIYAAGFAVGVTSDGQSAPQTEFLVSANTFGLISTDGQGQTYTPFVIQDGQAFINQAFIGTGWITDLMIGDTIKSTKTNAAGQPTWLIDKAGTITLNGDEFKIVHSSTGMIMTNAAGIAVVTVGKLG